MKVRMGFVSNSSSASFTIVFRTHRHPDEWHGGFLDLYNQHLDIAKRRAKVLQEFEEDYIVELKSGTYMFNSFFDFEPFMLQIYMALTCCDENWGTIIKSYVTEDWFDENEGDEGKGHFVMFGYAVKGEEYEKYREQINEYSKKQRDSWLSDKKSKSDKNDKRLVTYHFSTSEEFYIGFIPDSWRGFMQPNETMEDFKKSVYEAVKKECPFLDIYDLETGNSVDVSELCEDNPNIKTAMQIASEKAADVMVNESKIKGPEWHTKVWGWSI